MQNDMISFRGCARQKVYFMENINFQPWNNYFQSSSGENSSDQPHSTSIIPRSTNASVQSLPLPLTSIAAAERRANATQNIGPMSNRSPGKLYSGIIFETKKSIKLSCIRIQIIRLIWVGGHLHDKEWFVPKLWGFPRKFWYKSSLTQLI